MARGMRVKEIDVLLRKIKKDGIMEDIDVEELSPLQELKLANVAYKIRRDRLE